MSNKPAKILTFGISKGGCSKSTSSGIISFLLSQKDKKVLCVDMDGQGNLTSFLTGEFDICNVFEERTILEAILNHDIKPYIVEVRENLHLVPSNDYLAVLTRKMFENRLTLDVLNQIIRPVLYDYDYIIFDTPPSLSEQTLLPLSVRSESGSYAVVMTDGSLFSYYAIPKFLDIIKASQDLNPTLQPIGIILSLIDPRAKENGSMIELIEEEYPGMLFKTLVNRRATTRRIPINGWDDNPELDNAVELYKPLLEELMNRVEQQ